MGITSWQQQVPLPTSYFASTTNGTNDTVSLGYQQPNYWRLPLVPVAAASPISLTGNFLRGAVALGADGVAIFNPRNNTGQFSQAIGELDAYGGHCGLGDDYHYHIFSTHLTSVLGNDKPIAWGLDGYPVYGYVEPDGSAMLALDSDGGHDHGTWGYHYHARGTYSAGTATWTPASPYMMSAMHGTVVNYGGQIDPQPTGSGLRASGTGGYTAQPVAGASITAFKNPVALSVDGSGHFIENVSGTASNDDWLMRISISGVSYDICWRLNRNVNPKTMTITWRLPAATTTTTYNNAGNRITAYPMAANTMAKLPDTSQTLDSTATFGEDADYTINAQSFTDNGNSTITDNITGLMCTLFPAATATAYWSSTTVKGATTTEAWLVEFGINAAPTPPRNSQGIVSYEAKTSAYPVFAVRSASVTTQIAVSQNGTALTDALSTVAYGNVNVGSTSSKTFTINNTGASALTISGVTIDGTNASNFTVTTAPATTIAAGGSTTMDVLFSAASSGAKVAAIHIASSDTSVGAAFDIALSGTGYVPPPTITAVANQTTMRNNATSTLAFTVGDPQTAAVSLTVSATSSNATLVPVANIVFGGSGASRTVTVTPASGQTGTATITVTVSNGSSTTSTTFTLTVSPPNILIIIADD